MSAYTAGKAGVSPVDRHRAFPTILMVMAGLNCAIFLYFAERASIRVPVVDQLSWLQFYGEQFKAGHWLAYLWTPHNEHRIVLARIILALDVRWFGGRGTLFFVSGLLLLLASVAAVTNEIAKSDLAPSWRTVAIPLAILLMVPAHLGITLGMPAMSQYVQTSSFAIFSLVLLDGAADASRFANFRRSMALVTACIAAFGVSAGLVIWPVLLWTAWRGQLRWTWIAVIGSVGSVFAVLYLWKLPLNTVQRSFDPAHLVLSFDYAIRFLGLPWSHEHALVWPARAVGCAVLGLGCFALVKDAIEGGSPSRLRRLGLGLLFFSLLVAGSAALARVDVDTDREMPIRYGAFVVLAQLGLLLWSLEFLQRYWRPLDGRFAQSLIVAFCAVWLCQQVIVGAYAVREAHRYNDAWSRFVAGEWTPDMLHYVFPNREGAQAGLAALRKLGLYGLK
jgi:hypothetical protein